MNKKLCVTALILLLIFAVLFCSPCIYSITTYTDTGWSVLSDTTTENGFYVPDRYIIFNVVFFALSVIAFYCHYVEKQFKYLRLMTFSPIAVAVTSLLANYNRCEVNGSYHSTLSYSLGEIDIYYNLAWGGYLNAAIILIVSLISILIISKGSNNSYNQISTVQNPSN